MEKPKNTLKNFFDQIAMEAQKLAGVVPQKLEKRTEKKPVEPVKEPSKKVEPKKKPAKKKSIKKPAKKKLKSKKPVAQKIEPVRIEIIPLRDANKTLPIILPDGAVTAIAMDNPTNEASRNS